MLVVLVVVTCVMCCSILHLFACSHNFPDRLTKGEDVFHFCFYLLPFLIGDEFSYANLAALHHKPVPVDKFFAPVSVSASVCESGASIPCVVPSSSSIDERTDASMDPMEAVLQNQERGLPRVDSFSSFASSQTGSPFIQSQGHTPGRPSSNHRAIVMDLSYYVSTIKSASCF